MQNLPLIQIGPGRPYLRLVREADVSRPSVVAVLVLAAVFGAVAGGALTAWVLW